MVGSKRGTHELIKNMQKEQIATDIKYQQIMAGQPRIPTKNQNKRREAVIKRVLETKDSSAILDFLRGLVMSLQL